MGIMEEKMEATLMRYLKGLPGPSNVMLCEVWYGSLVGTLIKITIKIWGVGFRVV